MTEACKLTLERAVEDSDPSPWRQLTRLSAMYLSCRDCPKNVLEPPQAPPPPVLTWEKVRTPTGNQVLGQAMHSSHACRHQAPTRSGPNALSDAPFALGNEASCTYVHKRLDSLSRW